MSTLQGDFWDRQETFRAVEDGRGGGFLLVVILGLSVLSWTALLALLALAGSLLIRTGGLLLLTERCAIVGGGVTVVGGLLEALHTCIRVRRPSGRRID